jgi:hypothetical protein
MDYSNHWAAVSTPPASRNYWCVVLPSGERSRLYRTEAAAKAQLRRHPAGSTVALV